LRKLREKLQKQNSQIKEGNTELEKLAKQLNMVKTVKTRYKQILKNALKNEKVKEFVMKLANDGNNNTKHILELLKIEGYD